MRLIFLFNFTSILSLATSERVLLDQSAARRDLPYESPLPALKWRRNIVRAMKPTPRDLRPLQVRDTTTEFPEINAKFSVESTEYKISNAGGYPRLAKLADGTILSVQTLPKVNGTTSIMQVSKSTDGGKSFSLFSEVIRAQNKDLDNGFLIELPPSQSTRVEKHGAPVLIAAYRNHDLDSSGNPTYFRIAASRSEDGGRTWKEASHVFEISAEKSQGMGVWEPFMRIGNQGEVQLTYSGEIGPGNQETFRALSRDGGKSWTEPVNLRLHSKDEPMRDGMQSIISVKDSENGRVALVMALEVKIGAVVHLDYTISYDDGASWQNRSGIYDPEGDDKSAGAPQVANIGDGIVVVFMTDEDTEHVDWPKKAATKALFSDGLKNGVLAWTKNPLLVDESPSWWPGVVEIGDNEAMAVYGHDNSPRGRRIKKQ
ncbi:glycoside hydrolase family 93 protein [Hypoxylon rubiginosum]|uniref:Glycoside hydrolase family 93 protein n=1 Tax=Hypoxylon rubiginosum TaxID=110542 RepID=A0ACB9ZE87_9PEZI|nr:glycoside hydrolase family 93 protein [Hypoxylon rubiginosum]